MHEKEKGKKGMKEKNQKQNPSLIKGGLISEDLLCMVSKSLIICIGRGANRTQEVKVNRKLETQMISNYN